MCTSFSSVIFPLAFLFIRKVIGQLINSDQFVHNKMLHFRFDIADRIIIKMIIIKCIN